MASTLSSEDESPEGDPGDEKITLPTQTAYEVAIELDDYDTEEIESLFEAVWPKREIMDNRGDLITETAANMTEAVRHAFTNHGLDEAVSVAHNSEQYLGSNNGR